MVDDSQTWHALDVQETLSVLQTDRTGLTEDQARERLQQYGANEIVEKERRAVIQIALEQVLNPIIYVLFVAAIISFALGHLIDALVILGVVLANAVIGFFQEYRAEKAMAALRQLAAPTALVVRNGESRELAARALVPGDIVVLATGDKVPADGRILQSVNLRTDEAPLTGESSGVDKQSNPVPPDTPLAEQTNMVFAGTTVSYGRGDAVIVATGLSTRVGRIAAQVATVVHRRTPLQERLAKLGRLLAVLSLGLAVIIVAAGLIRAIPFFDIFLFAVASAVAAIPEGLPAVVTIALAIGLQRMASRNALVRKLPAVETLGSATIICSDKTGTLTKNQMTVTAIYTYGRQYEVTGEGYAPEGQITLGGSPANLSEIPELRWAIQVGASCNDAELICQDSDCRISGDPTEVALLTAAVKAGMDKGDLDLRFPRAHEIPFDPQRAYMATLHHSDDGRALFLKGAPEKVLNMSSMVMIDGIRTDFTQDKKDEVIEHHTRLASQALRVLALAYKEMPRDKEDLTPENVGDGLIFLGLMGMIDPPRPEAVRAIERCKSAGIRVMMATGDNRATAAAIAKEMGILRSGGEIIEGRELAAMSDDELTARIEDIDVMARVEPEQKLRIVDALKRRGHVVAVTGDGVNDAPALKKADIGVAMGITGTDVAKEASEMILTDDNFASIVAAVEEGRIIYNNIKKVIVNLLSTNGGEQIVIISTVLSGLPLPFTPVQILWINLITDSFPSLALAADPPGEDVLAEPPQDPKASIFSRGMLARIIYLAVITAIGTIALFYWALMTAGVAKARTIAFAAMSIHQLINAFNMRSPRISIFKLGLLTNRWLVLAVGFSLFLQVAAIEMPFMQALFHTVPLSALEWLLVLAVSTSTLWLEEIRKRFTKWDLD